METIYWEKIGLKNRSSCRDPLIDTREPIEYKGVTLSNTPQIEAPLYRT